MQKKVSAFSVIPAVLIFLTCFCACTRESAQTPASLLRAAAARDPAYAFPNESLFYKDGIWFAFFSLHTPNDLLLSMRVNDRQQIVRAAITARAGSEAAKEDLAPLGLLLGELLLPQCDPQALAAATGLALLPQTPAEILGVYTCQKDRAALFCGEHALSFFVELREYAEENGAIN